MEVVYIPINVQLREIGVEKITLSKYYFIIELNSGNSIFINNYGKYDGIYEQTGWKLEEVSYISDENKFEILKFLEDESQMIKKIIKNFRSWNR
jgi:hypothetical protein